MGDMPVHGTDDRDGAQKGVGEPGEHLLCVRGVLAGYAEYAGLTMGEILLPSMPEETRRHVSGQALMELLKALDPQPREGQNDEAGMAHPTQMPFLVCTLQHPPTGLRIALLAAAVAAT